MTRLSGEEPRQWHDAQGRHTQPHPESYETRRSYWSSRERAYARHLDKHRKQATDPSPLPGDSRVIGRLFDHIEMLQKIIEKEKLLIVALRQRAAKAPEADDKDVAEALRGRIGS